MQQTLQIPMVIPIGIGVAAYLIGVGLMFRKDKFGRRRRWLPLDFVWVPLGGFTVASLVVLWWHLK
ncbi:MAG TPA: hypothetical protein VH619_03880 [Verrucomicrobiae bacterium]|nr:hypothetical protein [Verrucomicrobiae bacterium]